MVRRLVLLSCLLPCAALRAGGLDVPVATNDAFEKSWSIEGFSHDLWEAVLQTHVDKAGLVDYAAVREDARFAEYLHRLANTDPARVGNESARKAFWINAYNALVLRGVIEALPADPAGWADWSVLDYKLPDTADKALFTGLRFQVGGRRYTLDEIEKGMLFGRGEVVKADEAHFAAAGGGRPDPRVHFVLVCGAKGCPPLRRDAMRGDTLSDQLDDATRRFVASDKVVVDRKAKILKVSQMLQWYASDLTNKEFAPRAVSVPGFLADYAGEAVLARQLREQKWNVAFIEYDWKLNVRR